jgi:hypothetical protein
LTLLQKIHQTKKLHLAATQNDVHIMHLPFHITNLLPPVFVREHGVHAGPKDYFVVVVVVVVIRGSI